jgi:WD40 repeat protein
MIKLIPFLLFLSYFPSLLFPYDFGKNKVQYKDFKWKILETEHFEIYYYRGGEFLAKFAASCLEDAYLEYSEILDVEFKDPVPVIIYNSPRDFRQTNVTLELIEEGVGGFTEIFKNRVVLPFTGSYYEFWHVLRHELVHVFQFNLFFRGFKPGLSFTPIARVPLWVMEGSAEYLSMGWSPEADMYLRDQVINERLIPISELEYYAGYVIYKEGQAFFRYIEDTYGKEKIGEFLHQIKFQRSFGGAAKKVFGLGPDQLDESFKNYLKRKYFPLLEKYEIPDRKEKRLTRYEKEGGFLNVAPTLSPSGDKVVLISDRSGYTDIYLISVSEGRVIKKLVAGQRSPLLEYLHIFRPGLSFSPDGKKIVFSAQAGKEDRLHIIDSERGKLLKSLAFDLDGIYTPSWSPDGSKIVFVGIRDGASDIYLYDLERDSLIQLTDDINEDKDPSFSPDGSKIIFVSDRKDGNLFFGSYALFEMEIDSQRVERLTPYLGFAASPFYINDTLISFVLEREGSNNLYAYSKTNGNFYRITNYLTQLKYPSTDYERKRVVFSLLWKGGYDVFLLENWTDSLEKVELGEVAHKFVDPTKYEMEEEKEYSVEFTVDWLYGAMEFSVPFGVYGAMTVGLSDQLGNHRIAFASDLFSDITNSDFEFIYLYLPKRIDYGFNFYQYWSFFPFTGDHIIIEKRLGIGGILYYPFDRFKRFEFGLSYERPKWYEYIYSYLTDEYIEVSRESYDLFSLYSGFVLDNALYGYTGPIDGRRFFIGGEKTFFSDLDYSVVIGDFRQYFRITRRSSFALKILGAFSGGRDALPFWIGGPNTLRGYDYYEFTGTRVALINSELRVPFVDHLKMAFPLPLDIRGIKGVIFFDMGNAWGEGEKFQPFKKGGYLFKLKDLKGGVGFGIRIGIGFVNLKFDIAKQTDLYNLSRETKYYLTVGRDF